MNQIEDMQTFKRIVEAGSISLAADQLDTVKSAVSRRLKDLEKRLNVTLLQRTTRRQTLTEAGHRYYQHCLRLLDDIAEAEAQISDIEAELSGKLRISAPVSFGLMHLGPALQEFQLIHPLIEMSIDFNDRLVDLIADGFDLAIRISRLEDSTLIAKKLSSTRLVVCASPEYLTYHGTPIIPTDLTNNHTVLHYRNTSESWQFQQDGSLINLHLQGKLTANNGNFLCDAAIAGQGIITSPDFICYQAVQSGQLQVILRDYMHDNELGIFAVYPQTRYLPRRSQILIAYLQNYFARNAPWLDC
ncbi:MULTISPECIES: LysR family transcriptional regulator [unclassified Methylophaga]|jgi:DNA-binding transcriptional LysR family regulator|uniref:LysR family transcriptional regulator n=1 Tax=unclassified Methylophaga TaxID=2629249 RepID=UPI000C8A6842|nr:MULTISPECIES: LysR family transcriptional regulator [unclassified Methylophaga]MAK65755.1 LysR family transcriptional regulator [Methylophaga sp.]MAY16479.1 LysR family transcriptional regulator [Methylophaga sp.]MBN45021.1 LysR family transcriptional regulator [Methylophaga sp.]HCD05846.1 LysR family transcriptional regulator [Methylophaga sp.]|tara:strand:- start:62834 stop:63739 length:906 start_codon:yes stop_codon:yes gene_type:complete